MTAGCSGFIFPENWGMSGDKYFIRDQNALYFVTFRVVDWLFVFDQEFNRKVMFDSLKFCVENKGLEIYAWCLMSNHFHAIIRAAEGYKLSALIRDFKRFTSRTITQNMMKHDLIITESKLLRFEIAASKDARVKRYKFWHQTNHAIWINPHNPRRTRNIIRYIHNNPVKAGIVKIAEDYPWSSARDYCGIEGPVSVKLLRVHG